MSLEPQPAPAKPDAAVVAGRGALFIGFAKAFFMFTGLVQKVLITHLIGPAEYGAFAVINGAVSTVNNTVVQGTVQSVSKFTAEDDARVDAVKRAGLRLQLFVGAAVALALVIGAPRLAAFHRNTEHTSLYRLVALIPFLYALYAVFVGSANGLRRFRTQAGFDVGFSTAKTILLLGGAFVAGLSGALAGFVTAAAVILVVAARVMGLPRGGAAGEAFGVRRLAAFMGGIVLYTLLINLALAFDLQLLPYLAGRVVDVARAKELTAYYDGVRNVSLLPYQALLVVTFVVFPLVSRATFENDRAATRAYVTQTLRYSIMLAAAMAVVLAARPAGLLDVLYPAGYVEAAPALPILVSGVCCLALLGVSGAIINAAGSPQIAVGLVAATVAVGGAAEILLVTRAAPGAAVLTAAAAGTALGMASGLGAGLLYMRRRFAASPPLGTVIRVAGAAAAAALVGRVFPGSGKVATLAAMAAVGIAYVAALVALGEFKADDRAKFRRILRRGS